MKWNKTNHQLFITTILTAMVIYSNVTETKQDWTALVVTGAFITMLLHPKDFISKESGNSHAILWQ